MMFMSCTCLNLLLWWVVVVFGTGVYSNTHTMHHHIYTNTLSLSLSLSLLLSFSLPFPLSLSLPISLSFSPSLLLHATLRTDNQQIHLKLCMLKIVCNISWQLNNDSLGLLKEIYHGHHDYLDYYDQCMIIIVWVEGQGHLFHVSLDETASFTHLHKYTHNTQHVIVIKWQ